MINIVIMMARVMMVIMTMIVTFLSQKVRKGLTDYYSLHSRAFSGFRGWADDGEEEGDEVDYVDDDIDVGDDEGEEEGDEVEIMMSMTMIQII